MNMIDAPTLLTIIFVLVNDWYRQSPFSRVLANHSGCRYSCLRFRSSMILRCSSQHAKNGARFTKFNAYRDCPDAPATIPGQGAIGLDAPTR